MKIVDQLMRRLSERTATIGVVGMGYAGLPLACRFGEAGFRTIGLDIDGAKIGELAAGRSYIGHIGDIRIARLVRNGRFLPSADLTRIAECDVAIICVPTPLKEGNVPNLDYVLATPRPSATTFTTGC
jgi:UDP-N-acetyl-D-glucosamine dehydrogenase